MRCRRAVWGRALASAALVAGIAVAGGAPSLAVPGDDAATVDVVAPGPAPVVLKEGPDGKSYWELTVEGEGAYIASWERSSGLWRNSGEAAAALAAMYDCRNKAVLKYADQFASYGAFNEAPGTKYDPETGLTITDPATVKARDACLKDSHISSDQVTSFRDKADKGNKGESGTLVVIQIPTALIGPGTHELFIAKFVFLAAGNPVCPKKTWDPGPGIRGGAITSRCNPILKDPKTFTVTVPRDASATVLGGPVVEPGSWFAPSAYSNLRVFEAPPTDHSGTLLVGLLKTAWPALLLGVVVALLVAGAGAGNASRGLTAAVRRVAPTSRRGGDPTSAARIASASGTRPWQSLLFGPVHGPLAFLIVLACAAVAAVGQEGFAWTERSARMALSFLASFLLLNYGSMVARWTLARRHGRGHFPRVTARPLYVVVLLASLALARVAGPEPALVFAAVLGVDYSLNTKDAGPGRPALAAIAGSVYMAAVGLIAWVGYTFLTANPVESFIRWDEIQPDYVAAVSDAGGFTTLAAGELLAIVAVVSVAALPITLLPLVPFDGALVWTWNRGVWVVCYIIAVALYSFMLQPWPGDGMPVHFATWLGLFAAYGLIGGGACVVMARCRRRERVAIDELEVTPVRREG